MLNIRTNQKAQEEELRKAKRTVAVQRGALIVSAGSIVALGIVNHKLRKATTVNDPNKPAEPKKEGFFAKLKNKKNKKNEEAAPAAPTTPDVTEEVKDNLTDFTEEEIIEINLDEMPNEEQD
jgi:hypothetical protein